MPTSHNKYSVFCLFIFYSKSKTFPNLPLVSEERVYLQCFLGYYSYRSYYRSIRLLHCLIWRVHTLWQNMSKYSRILKIIINTLMLKLCTNNIKLSVIWSVFWFRSIGRYTLKCDNNAIQHTVAGCIICSLKNKTQVHVLLYDTLMPNVLIFYFAVIKKLNQSKP